MNDDIRRPTDAKRFSSDDIRRPADAKRFSSDDIRRPADAKRFLSDDNRPPADAKRFLSDDNRRPPWDNQIVLRKGFRRMPGGHNAPEAEIKNEFDPAQNRLSPLRKAKTEWQWSAKSAKIRGTLGFRAISRL